MALLARDDANAVRRARTTRTAIVSSPAASPTPSSGERVDELLTVCYS